MSENEKNKKGAGEKHANFRMENLLVKNLSMEMPDDVVSPSFVKDANVQMEMRNTSRPLSRENYAEVVLEATVRVRDGEQTQLLIEVAQAGIFFVETDDAEVRQMLIHIHAAEMLYPYLSQLVSELMARGGAPRVFLPPFNFKALYEEKRNAIARQMASDGGAKT